MSTKLVMGTNGTGRRNRSWPEALKREIVAASYAPGSSVSMVARQSVAALTTLPSAAQRRARADATNPCRQRARRAARCVSRITPSVTGGHRNAPLLEPLPEQHQPGPVPGQDFQSVRSLRAEHKNRPGERIMPQPLAHQGDETIGTFAEVTAAWPPAPVSPPQPRSCRRLHGPQHIPQPTEINTSFGANHRPRNLDRDRSSSLRRRARRADLADRRHDRHEHGALLGRQGQPTSACSLAPGEQMLRRHLVPPREFRYHRSGRIGFRDDPTLVRGAPPPPAPNPNADINMATPLRSVNYMVNHRCEPISPNRFASCRSARAAQRGGRGPLALNWFRW